MLRLGSYEYICKVSGDIPREALSQIRPEVSGTVGLPISKMLPDFALAFPKTAGAMEEHWSNPVMALERRVSGNWLSAIVLEQPDLNLFIRPSYFGNPINGPDFEASHGMLPLKWRELYRLIDSFTITNQSVMPMGWINTMFPYSGRLTLEEFRQKIGAKKSKIREFVNEIRTDNVMCWLLTDAGHALFLNEATLDHKVYYVKDGAFEKAIVLPDPETKLDQYLAHYVAGKPPVEFDFAA